MRLAFAFLVSAVLGAPGQAPARACPILATSAKPILEVTWKNGRGPLAMYPIGFSKEGLFAWLERRQGFDSDDHVWLLYVSDLSSDRLLVEESFSTASTSFVAMCRQHGGAIAKILDQHKIERGAPVRLEQPISDREPSQVSIVPGQRDADAYKTPYTVLLHGKQGVKKVGVLWRVEEASGQPPLGVPKFRGILRSPTEPRVAVLVTQQMTGTEGVELTMVSILGGRLDKGWRAQP